MSTITKHNYKSKVIDAILANLFTAEERRLTAFIQAMCRKNQTAYGRQLDGFHYEGVFYVFEGRRGNLTREVLHESLEPEMRGFKADRDQVFSDKQLIKQCLFALLEPVGADLSGLTVSMVEQDYRDALPECLAQDLPDWARKLPRTREEAFTIKDNARAMRAYEKALPKIEFYSAARLLY